MYQGFSQDCFLTNTYEEILVQGVFKKVKKSLVVEVFMHCHPSSKKQVHKTFSIRPEQCSMEHIIFNL